MPGKSGIEVLQEITARYTDTGVIMITATADAETVIELMRMGAYDYMIKPVDINELSLRVRRALERRSLVIENEEYRLKLEEKVREQARKIHDSFVKSITSLAFALEARDSYTSGHSQRVSRLSRQIALKLGIDEVSAEKIEMAGLVHDIGKIGIKESILKKQEELTDEEYEHISTHSIIGERILRPAIDDKEILGIVRHHHEWYDGQGYPDGLSGEQIPLGARVLAVADMYDAMTSDRPYRKAVSNDIAISELRLKAEHQFDPVVVDAFADVMSEVDIQSLCNPVAAGMHDYPFPGAAGGLDSVGDS